MTEEKILYLIKENGVFVESTPVLRNNDSLFNTLYDMVHVKKYITWDQKGDSKGWMCHTYRITNLGLLRLALYRFSYAIRKDASIEENRLTELKELVKIHEQDAVQLKTLLGKATRKQFNKAFQD
ncbi:hypothetical protein XaC1_185 [Xanthomonas phage XaC1]|nr:hypothetical protein XaC1_185 [Xanthomonas phage XaC1]